MSSVPPYQQPGYPPPARGTNVCAIWVAVIIWAANRGNVTVNTT